MNADIRWLDDPKIFRVHQLPAHSDHTFYSSMEEMQTGKNSLCQSLNGTWQFFYSPNAKSGRCIKGEDMVQDMQILLKNHINAVRTSHYPNQLPWYTLYDENGIYLMAEANLESHGSWQKMVPYKNTFSP